MKTIRHGVLAIPAVLFAGFLFAQSAPKKPQAVLNHLAIYVVDLQKSMDFYSGIFQLDTIPEPFHDGKHAWYNIGPGVSLHVIAGAKMRKEYFSDNHMCFSVHSLEEFIPKLKASQINWQDAKGTKGAITTRVDGIKQIWIQDPDGYYIEVNNVKF